MQAKQNGLKGQSTAPSSEQKLNSRDKRSMMYGLSKVRSRYVPIFEFVHMLIEFISCRPNFILPTSVKKLNNSVTEHLVDVGVNAVGVSPCINIPGLQAHGGNENGGVDTLVRTILEALDSGLCPIVHGDAGLYGSSSGILGGDTLVEIIATHKSLEDRIAKVIFLTDVEGVFTKDPRSHQDAQLIKSISVTKEGNLRMKNTLTASGSSHEHDVTGGLEAKLASAIAVAKRCIPVIIAKCCSSSGRDYIVTKDLCSVQGGTIISLER